MKLNRITKTKPSPRFVLLITLAIVSFTIYAKDKDQIIRIAKLQIDSAQLSKYKAALQEEIETSVRIETGVLSLYAVAEKGRPTRITIFEIYANESAYKSHLETPHFKKYKSVTKEMVKSLELMETDPIVLRAKLKP